MQNTKLTAFITAMRELTEQDKEIMRLQSYIEGLESRIQMLQNQLDCQKHAQQ